MKKSAVFCVIIAMMAAMAVILAACGGGGGGGDSYVVQELDLDAPNWIIFSDLAWDGVNFWAHSVYGDAGSVIFAFDTSGSQVDSFQNPLWGTFYSIRGMEYGNGSLWTLAVHSITNDFMVFEMTTVGAIASSFTLPDFYRYGIAYADSLIWVPASHGVLTSNDVARFDPGNGTQVGPALTLSSAITDIRGFCEGGGYLWVLDAAPGFGIHKFDKTTGSEVNYFDLSQFGNGITWDGSYLWMSRAPVRIDAYDFQ